MTNVKCIRDDVGYWTEGKVYQAIECEGGSIQLGDDDDPENQTWVALVDDYREDGSILYAMPGMDGDVHFEEAVRE